MATKTGYSAGRVFLQVVPSYKNFMTQLRRDANGPLGKAIADTFEKSLEKAGYSAGEAYADKVEKAVNDKASRGAFASKAMKALERSIDQLDPRFEGLKQRMKGLHDDFEAGSRDANILADELHDVAQSLKRIGQEDSDIDVRVNAGAAHRELAKVAEAGRAVGQSNRRLGADSDYAARALGRVGDGGNRASKGLRGTDDDSQKARRGLRALTSGTNDAANSFRFFSFAVLAAATIGPAIIPMLAAVAGGLAAVGVAALAAGAAAGVAALGLGGISRAVQAMGRVQESGASSARTFARAQVMAARAVADARRSLADARRNASESVRRALESERQAEMRLADAQRDAKRAQEELTQARKEAKEELMDLANQVAQNQLDERQGVIDLFNAYTTYGATMADGGATNLEKEQADINLQQAELNLKRIREEQARLAEEKKKADKEGINGTETVIRAQDRVTEAVNREKEARRDLQEASRDVDRARADGARMVADAQRQLNRALEDQKHAATQASAANTELANAMKNLSPAAREFARFIFGLREGFYELRAIAAEGMLPGLQAGLERIINHYGPGFRRWVKEMSESLGQLSREWARSFTSRPWTAFFRDFRGASVRMNEDMARGFMGFGEGLAEFFRLSLPTAEKFTQWLERIGKRFSEWSQSDAGRESIKNFFAYVERVGPKVVDFFESLIDAGVAIGKALAPVGETILGALTDFFNWVAGMDPAVLRLIAGGILAIVAAMQISTGLVAFVSIIGIIGGSWALGALVAVTAIASAFVFLGSDAGKASGALGKLMDALRPVGEMFKEIGGWIKDHWVAIWNKQLEPGLKRIAQIITRDLLPAFARFWPVIRPIVHFLVDVVFSVIASVIAGIIDVVQGVLKVLTGLMNFVTGVLTVNWALAWKGIRQIVGGVLQALWGLFQIWIFGKIFGFLKGIFTKRIPSLFRSAGKLFHRILIDPFKRFGGWIKGFIDDFIRGIGRMRDRAKEIFSAIGNFIGKRMGNPIMTVVDVVLNKGLIGGVNKLLGWLNIGKVGTVPIKKFARGGVVDGYAPGQDKVHAYLSPGEGILRPEVTKAIGPQWIRAVNDAAIRGGVGAVQSALGLRKFAAGGVVMPVKGSRNWTTYPGHTGIDFPRAYGTGVYAATSGRVTSAPRWGYSYGHHINLQGGGRRQIYAHLSSILAKVGAIVAKGQQIGKVGSTGNSTGPHLHFEVRPGGTAGAAAAFLRGAGAPSGKALPSIWEKLSSGAIKALANPVGFLKDRISFGGIGGLTGGMGRMLKAVPGKFFNWIFDWMKNKAGKILGVTGKFFGSAASKISDVFGFLGGKGGPGSLKLYDRGGYLPPGYSTVLNATGRPEPVLAPDQWDKILAGGGTTVNVTVNGSNLDASDVADEMLFALKRAGRRR